MDPLILSRQKDIITFYRTNPTIALIDLLNIELAVPQRIVFNDMWNNKFSIITAGRGTGKSYMLAAFACLRGMLYPGSRIGLLAPSFRQAKIVFEEVKKMWFASPILREATTGKPTTQSDRCVLNFRAVGTTPPALIEADPLGDGQKIRGLRMHILLVDEFAQLPEVIFDSVIKPMAATSSSPMERVKFKARIKYLQERGFDTTDLLATDTTNKIIMASSAFYKFNHMYRRIEEYQKFIEKGSSDFAVRTLNYLDMPDGFMNEDNIQEARDTMPASLFRMEYLAIWESDSDGIFKASLLEKCKLPLGDTVRLKGDPDKKYIIACDPARTSDFFSVVVFELGDKIKVVYAAQYKGMKFPKMAEELMRLCSIYNVERLVIDSQGGGLSIKDDLASARFGKDVIIDIDDEEYLGVSGRRILQMVNPSPTYNAEANYATLNLLEQGKLWFAGQPISGDDAEEVAYENISEMVRQMLSIIVTQTKSGNVHFDVPTGGGHGVQKKDLYSAFIYGSFKAYQLLKERDSTEGIIWNAGIVIPRGSGTKYISTSTVVSPFAVLNRSGR